MGKFIKILFFLGIALLILSGVSIILNHLGFAQRILTFTFWILLGGLIPYLSEIKYES